MCKNNVYLVFCVFIEIKIKRLILLKDLDILLMYVIICNLIRNLIKLKYGWGNSLSESDINIVDDIERICIGRNWICYENVLNMEIFEFNELVLDLIWVIF